MNTYADVALPVGIDKTFTYLIPPELRPFAQVGVRTVVPFGRKYLHGLIVELPASSPITSLKPIKDILDAGPVVSEELLRLCRWIAEYYVTPLGEVLKAAIPYGFASASKRLVSKTDSTTEAVIDRVRTDSPKRADILTLLADHGPMFAGVLQKRTGVRTINAMLNELERAGYIESEEQIPHPPVKPRTRKVILLEQVAHDRLAEILASLPPRKKKARQMLEYIQTLIEQGTKELSVADLLKGSKTASSTLKEFAASLPIVLQEVNRQAGYGTEEQTKTISLNSVQQQVLQKIVEGIDTGHQTFLLHGVTGSGKTQVYIEAIRHCIQRNKTAIVLVPEISLTPQTVRRFKTHFAENVAVMHSRLSPGERYDVWRQTLRGNCKIVIGPRSVVFAPLRNLGLIIVDEEHESSYKQFDALPRYNARDVAVVRGSLNRSVVVLGSATPSVESYYNAMNKKYTLLEMPQRIDDHDRGHDCRAKARILAPQGISPGRTSEKTA
jgi:primosomal protein N' (replication factor Y) (superfamily II helicase)